MNVIISYSFRVCTKPSLLMHRKAPPSYLRHCHCDWLNHTMCSNRNCRPSPLYTTWYGRCHLVSGGSGYVWLAEPYHVVPLESSTASKHRIWVNIVSFFLYNTDANMLCRLFDDSKYMNISPYTSRILLSWKTKNQFVFFRMDLWTLVIFTLLGF